MLDVNFIREHKEKVATDAKNKKVDVDIDGLLNLDLKRRELILKVDDLRSERNEHAKNMGQGKPNDEQIKAGKDIKDRLQVLEDELTTIESDIYKIARLVPNVVSEDTPVGPDESGNIVLKKVGEIPEFSFEPKVHADLLEPAGLVDKERAARVSGARFAYHIGALVELEMALQKFVIDTVTNENVIKKIVEERKLSIDTKTFTLVVPPEIIRTDVMEKTGRLDPPEDKYHISGEDLVLVGSAEHSVGPMHMEEILPANSLPLRYLGISTAFRKEAGTYGKDMHGILRVHQFRKLELETLSDVETSNEEQELMIGLQEYIHQALGIPYQVVAICTGDMGKPDFKQVDIEAWFAGENKYRETATSDHVSDFQSRRLNIRYKSENGNVYVHMNDATALSERPMLAIIENNQTADGKIRIPDVLKPLMNNKEYL